MDKNEIQKLIRDEINSFMNQKQYTLSKIQSHEHNGTDCKKIPIQNLDGVTILPASETPSSTVIFSQQLTPPNNQPRGVFSIPLPTLENASGDPTVLGEAPDGTLILSSDVTTSPPTIYLNARVGGLWYSVQLT